MKFEKIKYGLSNSYYIGEYKNSGGYYDPCGIGIMQWEGDKRLIMANNYSENSINGLGFEYNFQGRYGAFSTFNNGRFYGPTMSFGFEKYLIYENYDYNERPQNYSIYVYYNGNYKIYKETDDLTYKGVLFENGYLYFVQMDRKLNVFNSKMIKYIGNEYAFTSSQIFPTDLNYYRPITTYGGVTNTGVRYELSTQLLNSDSNKSYGYGAIKWNDGEYYFGEWLDGYRFGLGCYIEKNGTKHIGKYHYNNRQGSVLSLYNNGIIRMGNWKANLENGVSFEIGNDYVTILNFNNGKMCGNKFYINNNSKSVTEFNDSGTVAYFNF